MNSAARNLAGISARLKAGGESPRLSRGYDKPIMIAGGMGNFRRGCRKG